jgi:hypothetical protein
MEKKKTNLFLRKDIKKRAIDAVDHGYFGGVGSLSGLVEKALEELLDRSHVPKVFVEVKQEV